MVGVVYLTEPRLPWDSRLLGMPVGIILMLLVGVGRSFIIVGGAISQAGCSGLCKMETTNWALVYLQSCCLLTVGIM